MAKKKNNTIQTDITTITSSAIQAKELEIIKEDILQLRKSYQVLNDHSGQITQDISEIKTNVEWLIWAMRGVIFAIIVSLLINLLKIT